MVQKTYKYYAIFGYSDDGITVTFPDLPGCITCGESIEEAIQMAREALELFLEDIREEEMPIPSMADDLHLDEWEKTVLIETRDERVWKCT